MKYISYHKAFSYERMTVRVRDGASLGVVSKGRGPPRVAIIVEWVFVTSRELPISRYQQGLGVRNHSKGKVPKWTHWCILR